MTRYDPFRAPNPDEWLAMDDQEKVALVDEYHRRADDRVPDERAYAHATFHCMVENQIALGDETTVAATIERLMAEGLDRHEAVHAVASVLAELVYDLSCDDGGLADVNAAYEAALAKLTAESWRRSG